ncbi:hypothetical protein P7C73_g6141, partial [Tremellales sp. Uapishka_1]
MADFSSVIYAVPPVTRVLLISTAAITFMNDTPNYAWMHVVLGIAIHILNIPFGFPFLFRAMLHAQTYLWCRANPTLKMSIFGLLTLPTSLYPPALVVLDIITGGPPKAIVGVLGIIAGHLWWYLSTYLPFHAPAHLRRRNPLPTPVRFRALFSPPASRTFSSTSWGGTRVAPAASGASTARDTTASQSAADAVRHRWGGGQKLGGVGL